MNCPDWNEKLHDHADGALSAAESRALDAHLADCAACRARLDSLRALRAATRGLPHEFAPARDLWPEIETQIGPRRARRAVLDFPPAWRVAAGIAVLCTLGAGWRWHTRPAAPGWSIAALAGEPRVGNRAFQGEARLRVGQWLETGPTARAQVTVGSIGEVSLAPNSRVRLVAASATEHRLELARGTLSALIWAPPRLFFVDTPSATAVDLGCAYTLEVDGEGNGTLHVTSGYVALQHAGRESIIPAGLMCSTRRGAGPGTPVAADAAPALRRALDRFDFEQASDALPEILAHARAGDAVTLWHLLARTTGAARGGVFDTLARDHAPPDGVTRVGILAGDPAMTASWAAELGLFGFHRN